MSRNHKNNLIDIANNKYNRLLPFLFFILIAAPFSKPSGFLGLLLPLIFLGLLITAIYSFLNFKTLFLYLILGGSFFLLRVFAWLNNFSEVNNLKLAIVISSINAVFMALSIYFIIEEIFSRKIITVDVIKGGIVVYILLGLLWFELYKLVNWAFPNSFSSNEEFELLHFSFITLSTVGYGDILPISKFAKILANLEGIVGVLYPAIFIARLVSLYERDRL
ncbi:putative ion transport protein [Stanieria sp. NIES-3757]|nr:putative ion transport protein [Stanieria sp. NIES-3757]